MAQVAQADKRGMYSWWWNSHISPKNSKWLQENLTDMDVKLKQMIKLIEEDADSFARRAEMYYKKRPELMKLVEEFYRAYRALAERYDHATGVIRQAHRTMAEAFPNQVPSMFADDSPAGAGSDADPQSLDTTPVRAFFDPDDLQKDGSGHFDSAKKNGAYTDESHAVGARKGLKQLDDMFGSGEGRARKGLNFHDGERGMGNGGRVPSESERVSKAELEISTLKNALAKLEAEKESGLVQYQQSLERLSTLESEVSRAKEDSRKLNERASTAEAEVQMCKEALTKLEAEREATISQYQQCLDKISNLENVISLAQKDAEELSNRATRAEAETHSLKQEMAKLEEEKEVALLQYRQCLGKISDLEDRLLRVEEDARRSKERADAAEKELEALKLALAKIAEEKKAASLQYQQCLETISILEQKLACAEEEAKKLHAEVDDGVGKLKDAEERCLLLERTNQTMHSDLESLTHKTTSQSKELTEKQKELGRLWTCIQEERMRFVEAETAFQTLQHLHAQSQEELRSMAAELQNRVQILENLEALNQNLRNEVEQVKTENKDLCEVKLSSALTVENLQHEISSLRETIRELEATVELRVDERNALQQEIYCLKEEINDLNKKHQAVVEQVESVGYSPDCLVTSVKDLQDENMNLKEACERDKSEKVTLLAKLEILEKLTEKNAFLENSLSDLNVELEGVRAKVKTLEESRCSLLEAKSSLESEKIALASQLQVLTDTIEKLTEKNTFLENSLLDANAELEELRTKLNNLEGSCLLLTNEKSELVVSKEGLISQLDVAQKGLADLERNCLVLKERYSDLEKERDSTLHELAQLRVTFDAEKKEHANFAELSKSQLESMASKIGLLQEDILSRENNYACEVDKSINSQIEIFILQKCVEDLKGRIRLLLLEYQKLSESSELSKKLIAGLEHKNLEQHEKEKSLFDRIKMLRAGFYQVSKFLELDANGWCEDKIELDMTHIDCVLNKMQETRDLLFKTQDQNQQLNVEVSVLVALLDQLQLEVANLAAANTALEEELRNRSGQSLVLQGENKKHVETNEILQMKLNKSNSKLELLDVELQHLQEQLMSLQCANESLKQANSKVLKEKDLLTKLVSDLKEEKCHAEEEKCIIFAETMSQNILSLILGDAVSNKSVEVKELGESLNKLHCTNNSLNETVKSMEMKLDELRILQDEKMELLRIMENLKCKCDEAEVKVLDQEQHIVKLSRDNGRRIEEATRVNEANEKLEDELCTVNGELVEAKHREESLNNELVNRRIEVEVWESLFTSCFSEVQMVVVREAVLEGKLYEVIEEYENLGEKNCSNVSEIEKLKEIIGLLEGENQKLKAWMTLNGSAFISLKDCITSLENHTLSDATIREVDSKQEEDALQAAEAEKSQQMGEQKVVDKQTEYFDLQELEMRVRQIEKAVVDKKSLLMLENSSSISKLDEIKKHQVGLEARKHLGSRSKAKEVEVGSINDRRLQKQRHEISEEGSDAMTKDIMLDQISECSSYGISRRETTETDDSMLEIWETADRDGNIGLAVGKGETFADKKHRIQNPSAESLFEKEVSIDKLEISQRFSGSYIEGTERKILERLDSDAQKLTNLQITVHDLKRKVEFTEKIRGAKDMEFDSMKEQLEESEEAIMKLFDVNRRLIKNVENESSQSAIAGDENGRARRRRVSEQARRVSEKIGRLQLEIQKLQFLLLKLDDENNRSKGKSKITERSSSVLLQDYIYGSSKRQSPKKKKKSRFCACVRPPTTG